MNSSLLSRDGPQTNQQHAGACSRGRKVGDGLFGDSGAQVLPGLRGLGFHLSAVALSQALLLLSSPLAIV